jgi:hypothetical protein
MSTHPSRNFGTNSSNKTCLITTKAVSVVDDKLCVSADVVPSRYVKVTALDEKKSILAESKLITETVTDAEVQWKEDLVFKDHKGDKIKLRFELRDSKLYSFSFHD